MLSAGLDRPVLDELRAHDPVALTEAVHALSRYSATSWLGEVDVPTAVIVSERDDVIVPAQQRTFVELIPHAHVLSADHDHLACFTQPEAFADLLLDACAVVTPAAPTPSVGKPMRRLRMPALRRVLSRKRSPAHRPRRPSNSRLGRLRAFTARHRRGSAAVPSSASSGEDDSVRPLHGGHRAS
jgi:hypothetical protein